MVWLFEFEYARPAGRLRARAASPQPQGEAEAVPRLRDKGQKVAAFNTSIAAPTIWKTSSFSSNSFGFIPII